jgi:hypothetical protein
MTGAIMHIGTMPDNFFRMLSKHPLTDRGLELFASDWEKARAILREIGEPAGTHKGAR